MTSAAFEEISLEQAFEEILNFMGVSDSCFINTNNYLRGSLVKEGNTLKHRGFELARLEDGELTFAEKSHRMDFEKLDKPRALIDIHQLISNNPKRIIKIDWENYHPFFRPEFAIPP